MVELVDSVDLGSTAKSVQVRVLLPAPNQYNPNLVFPVGDGFGLFFSLEDSRKPISETVSSNDQNPSREDQEKRNRFRRTLLWIRK